MYTESTRTHSERQLSTWRQAFVIIVIFLIEISKYVGIVIEKWRYIVI